jgi:enoyl-CoA hydratase/carnithine racemase
MDTAARAPTLTTTLDEGVAVVTLDLPGEKVNKFSRAVREEFAAAFAELQDDRAVRAIVIISGKEDLFVAGADIEEFVALRTAEDATRLSREGQRILDLVAASPKPVVAAIHGACLGGGLELALACHYRIATDHPKTVLGLPEVQLGIIPGAGGCNRLPRQVGLRRALEMILTGKSVRAGKALKMRLVDELVAAPILQPVAVAAARRLVLRPPRRRRGGSWFAAWSARRSYCGRPARARCGRPAGTTRRRWPPSTPFASASRTTWPTGCCSRRRRSGEWPSRTSRDASSTSSSPPPP